MTHFPLLNTFFRLEIILSTILILTLLALGVTKKDRLVSDTAITRLKEYWPVFKVAFVVGFTAMVLFLALLTIEFIEFESNLAFRSLYPLLTEWIKVFLVLTLFLVNLINLYLVLSLIGGDK